MKKKLGMMPICFLLIAALTAGCAQVKTNSSKAMESSQKAASSKKEPNTNSADSSSKGIADQSEPKEVKQILPELGIQFSIPADWTIWGSEYIKNGRTQLYMEEHPFSDAHIKNLMKEFGYPDEKACMKEYIYNGSEWDEGVEYDKQELILPSYRFKGTADKYYKSGEGQAVDNSEPIILQAMIDRKKHKLYMLYFTDEMADEKKADEFLAKMTRVDEKEIYDEEFGLYRWQGGADYFSE